MGQLWNLSGRTVLATLAGLAVLEAYSGPAWAHREPPRTREAVGGDPDGDAAVAVAVGRARGGAGRVRVRGHHRAEPHHSVGAAGPARGCGRGAGGERGGGYRLVRGSIDSSAQY